VSKSDNGKHPRVRLKIIPTPGRRPAVSAPPILVASTHTTDYICGNCEANLMHAEEGQVYNLVIHCVNCGLYNTTDA
jgi:DNA-directed RNA polymerase subunit RPC12/RpoP